MRYRHLPESGNPSMTCTNEDCESWLELYSATRGDYFWAHPDEVVRCSTCDHPMHLARERRGVEILN